MTYRHSHTLGKMRASLSREELFNYATRNPNATNKTDATVNWRDITSAASLQPGGMLEEGVPAEDPGLGT